MILPEKRHDATAPPTRSKGGFTPLLFAAHQGDLDGARILLNAGADVNETSSDGSALLVATIRGHVPLAIFLLDQGANPNASRNGLHGTPLGHGLLGRPR